MEIKIDATDMLYVLVDSGLDAMEAKAIIFDLLHLPKGDERRKLLDARREKVKARRVAAQKAQKQQKKQAAEEEEYEDDDFEDDFEEDFEDDETFVKKRAAPAREEPDPLKPTKVRKSRTVNMKFNQFGGKSEPLR